MHKSSASGRSHTRRRGSLRGFSQHVFTCVRQAKKQYSAIRSSLEVRATAGVPSISSCTVDATEIHVNLNALGKTVCRIYVHACEQTGAPCLKFEPIALTSDLSAQERTDQVLYYQPKIYLGLVIAAVRIGCCREMLHEHHCLWNAGAATCEQQLQRPHLQNIYPEKYDMLFSACISKCRWCRLPGRLQFWCLNFPPQTSPMLFSS